MQKNECDSLNQTRGDCANNPAFLMRLAHDAYPTNPLAVALSGGADSMALLFAAQTVARARNVQLTAFHIHHDLQKEADDWLVFVRDHCAAQQITFASKRLDSNSRRAAQSIEEWARQGRYAALTQLAHAHNISTIWLAQHQDDQIETHLLQKKRGAGAKGLAAMPHQIERANVVWVRPWLDAAQSQIEAFINAHHVAHINDPSNHDPRFARNALRQRLKTQTPSERQQILQDIASAQMQYAAQTQWAAPILAAHLAPHQPEIGEHARLKLTCLQGQSDDAQKILLRAWLAQLNLRMPSQAALNELLKQLHNPRADQHMCWQHADGWAITLFRQQIIVATLRPNGAWFLTPTTQQMMVENNWTAQPRTGGERIRLAANRPHISLQNAYLQSQIPPMLRAQLPLLYQNGVLRWAVGVGEHVV
jgi:tRNA(Ile)-lysidine synthase